MVKVEGKTRALNDRVVDAADAHTMIYSILTDAQISEFEQNLELNIAFHIPDAGRFRINVFKQRGEMAMVARYIKSHIPAHRGNWGCRSSSRTLSASSVGCCWWSVARAPVSPPPSPR